MPPAPGRVASGLGTQWGTEVLSGQRGTCREQGLCSVWLPWCTPRSCLWPCSLPDQLSEQPPLTAIAAWAPGVCVQALALQCAGQGCSSGQQSPLLLSYPSKEWLEAVGV